MLISPDKLYTHKKSGRIYRVLRLGFLMKCPETHAWFKAVMYEPGDYGPDKDYGNGEVYVRSQKDFVAAFAAKPEGPATEGSREAKPNEGEGQ